MKYEDSDTRELLKKYRLAGKIRLVSFSLLTFFLLLMKVFGGYAYLNLAFIALILVEAIINQPYEFFISRVDIRRFQYYQMATDIIVISWVLYYMGGIEAPIVSIAYYGVILWAGIASTTQAVFFAVVLSSVLFSFIVGFEYFGFLPLVSYYGYRMPASQMTSLLIGNIAFLFAFGYFSAHSSLVIRSLQRKRQEESLRNAHKLTATGHLVSRTAHDLLNNLTNAQGYTRIVLEQVAGDGQKREMLEAVDRLQHQSVGLISRLGSFAQKEKTEFSPTDIHKVIEDALELANPILRYSKMAVEKVFDSHVPRIYASDNELQEAFLVFILNSLDAVSKQGKLTIKTAYAKKDETVTVIFSDTGIGIKQENLKRMGEMFFTTKEQGEGLGLGTAYGIIQGYNGKIDVESAEGKGTTFRIQLPVMQRR